jgi:triosephosphate isomerase (TIM)
MKQTDKTIHLIGNWKMNPGTLAEAEILLKDIVPLTKTFHSMKQPMQLSLAVPALYILPLVKLAKERIQIGVQNIHSQDTGAYTGDISGLQVVSTGARFTVIGHSERRLLGESDSEINQKVLVALKQKLSVVLCVGETIRDVDGEYLNVIRKQVTSALAGVTVKQLQQITIAYEPVWAIGVKATGIATPHESLEVSILIRRSLHDLYSAATAKKVVLLYGGSANSDNVADFIASGGVQGFLLGRASLNATELGKIAAALA